MTQRYEFEWFSWVFRVIKESEYSLEYVHMNLPLNKKKKKIVLNLRIILWPGKKFWNLKARLCT